MAATKTNRLLLFILFVFLQTNYFSFSQTASYPLKEWTKKLSAKDAPVLSGVFEICIALKNKDSSEVINVFNELGKRGSSSNKYFTSRLYVTEAVCLFGNSKYRSKNSIQELMKEALNDVYETDNDSLVSAICWQFGSMTYYSHDIELASMYCLNAAETDEKIGRQISAPNYRLLGDVLYTTRDNERCIYYFTKATEVDTSIMVKEHTMSNFNTIGLCWRRIGNYDSAFFYFSVARKMAIELDEKIWQSIISGNEGQVYYSQQKYALAKPLLEYDYRFSKQYGEFGSASNSLQWVARINLIEGKKDSALMQVKEAMQLLQKDFNPNYWQNICYATADAYRAFGDYDSVYKYSQLYNHLHDSIERAVADSRLEISRIKLDNLQNELTIKNLHKERQAEELKRNFILAVIVMCSVIGILVVNRQRQRAALKQQLALQEKRSAEAEAAAAKEQLSMFRQNIIEKTDLIERLQHQVHQKEISTEQLEIVNELTRQTILTEADWDQFKKLFEKIYLGFFMKLKERAPDMTVAEQRMAALTRLHLTTKQMASMLGISTDSVHKTRQRLRQRLQVSNDSNLEEIIIAI
jgi:DNA-binding CsgD family transcriptional regulator